MSDIFNRSNITGLVNTGISLFSGLGAANEMEASGAASMQAATYNANLLRANMNIELDILGRQFRKAASTQRAQATSGAVGVTSTSGLAVMQSTLAQFEREIKTKRTTTQNSINQALYEGQLAQAAANRQASQARGQAIGGAISNVFKLFM